MRYHRALCGIFKVLIIWIFLWNAMFRSHEYLLTIAAFFTLWLVLNCFFSRACIARQSSLITAKVATVVIWPSNHKFLSFLVCQLICMANMVLLCIVQSHACGYSSSSWAGIDDWLHNSMLYISFNDNLLTIVQCTEGFAQQCFIIGLYILIWQYWLYKIAGLIINPEKALKFPCIDKISIRPDQIDFLFLGFFQNNDPAGRYKHLINSNLRPHIGTRYTNYYNFKHSFLRGQSAVIFSS